ncbi:Ankyrin repeat domain-containing protein 49-like protein [Leptotrombidium deliense]|uniref:Alpha-latrotoxin n=1 Tax=Leptotrombidium deliense TaxID=299467 RepID=A0A443SNJ5_9ACAR|nr:Ankyrin repeat domain-containing protein 49-like protein [Leptotrombidium deliense]
MHEIDDEDSVTDNVTPAEHRKVLTAAETGDTVKLSKYLQRNSELAFVVDCDGYTPLHRASQGNHCDAIKLLLDRGVPVNAQTANGWTALHCASHWKNIEAAALLLDNGADVNALTSGNVTALHLAAAARDRRLLELFLYHPDIDIDIKNDSGDTAYAIAVRNGPFAVMFNNI